MADLVFDLLLSIDNPKESEITVKVVHSYLNSLETYFDLINLNEKWTSIKTNLNLPNNESLILTEEVYCSFLFLDILFLFFRQTKCFLSPFFLLNLQFLINCSVMITLNSL